MSLGKLDLAPSSGLRRRLARLNGHPLLTIDRRIPRAVPLIDQQLYNGIPPTSPYAVSTTYICNATDLGKRSAWSFASTGLLRAPCTLLTSYQWLTYRNTISLSALIAGMGFVESKLMNPRSRAKTLFGSSLWFPTMGTTATREKDSYDK